MNTQRDIERHLYSCGATIIGVMMKAQEEEQRGGVHIPKAGLLGPDNIEFTCSTIVYVTLLLMARTFGTTSEPSEEMMSAGADAASTLASEKANVSLSKARETVLTVLMAVDSPRYEGLRHTVGQFATAIINDNRELAERVAGFKTASEANASRKRSGDSRCFVATVCYGDENCREVVVLRSFRDRVLLQSRSGRFFVSAYYVLGPVVAQWLQSCPRTRTVVRRVIVDHCVRWIGRT
jgi:hypothetical protein